MGDVHKTSISGNLGPNIGGGILTQHWATSPLMRKRYEIVDELGVSLRPLAFIIATNRTLNGLVVFFLVIGFLLMMLAMTCKMPEC